MRFSQLRTILRRTFFERPPVFIGIRRNPTFRAPFLRLGRTSPLIYALIVAALISIPFSFYLQTLVRQYSRTASSDHVRQTIAAIISEKMLNGEYGYDYFVTLEKDGGGNITAITANTVRINALSAEIVSDISAASANGRLDLRIPLGTLTDSVLLSGRGPTIPVCVVLLTASAVNFVGDFQSAGINQTKHQILLDVSVDVNLLIPRGSLAQTISAQLLVAETVIVGKVPENYINLR